MTVRFASRFITHSVIDVVKEFLATYGWTGDSPPFGTDTVEVRATAPQPSDLRSVAGNMVFVSFGDEDDTQVVELGGGMLRQDYVVFVDVVGIDESIAAVLAGELKQRLSGQLGGTRYLRPRHPGTGVYLPGYLGEFTDVMKYSPDGERRSWATVSCVLAMDFPGDDS